MKSPDAERAASASGSASTANPEARVWCLNANNKNETTPEPHLLLLFDLRLDRLRRS